MEIARLEAELEGPIQSNSIRAEEFRIRREQSEREAEAQTLELQIRTDESTLLKDKYEREAKLESREREVAYHRARQTERLRPIIFAVVALSIMTGLGLAFVVTRVALEWETTMARRNTAESQSRSASVLFRLGTLLVSASKESNPDRLMDLNYRIKIASGEVKDRDLPLWLESELESLRRGNYSKRQLRSDGQAFIELGTDESLLSGAQIQFEPNAE